MTNILRMREFTILLLAALSCYEGVASYQIGVGRADCTGPPVDVIFMGYANMKQRGEGLHLRQFARTFLVDDGSKRVVFVSVDGAMISHAVKQNVVKKLQLSYGDIYQLNNVMISGTHTHGAPGGHMMHVLYDISTLGFVQQTFDALVNGIFNSIVKSHANMQSGKIYHDETEILDANINRSPTSYLNNPEEERAQFKYDTDKTLTQLRFVGEDDKEIGVLNWYAVHPVSMNNTNHLVSSDNVGYASILLEKELNPGAVTGQGKVVAAFASANLGDVSPNVNGPRCELSGMPCDLLTSTCPADEGACFATGPGKDQFDSCKIIATRLFDGARRLLKKNTGVEVTGSVNYAHQFLDMSNAKVEVFNAHKQKHMNVSGCLPAMGYSFAAGTTDGPGAFDFTQGTTSGHRFWNMIRNFLGAPTLADIACHAPKPILLATGRIKRPYPWQPIVVPTQLFQIGDVMIAGLPGEFTTMAGRRVRKTVRDATGDDASAKTKVILAGLSNIYTSYVTTFEEYQMQRFEAAATSYGPHTLAIHLSQFEKLTKAIHQNKKLDSGPEPVNFDNKVISLTPAVLFDTAPFKRSFGDVSIEPNLKYTVGEHVTVQFISANPRNNLQHEKTYFAIEQSQLDQNWTTVATDADWETRFIWTRKSSLLGTLRVMDIHWDIPKSMQPGVYRVTHYGSARNVLGKITNYSGKSREFSVLPVA